MFLKTKAFRKVRQCWVQIPPLSLPQLRMWSKLVNLLGPLFHPLHRRVQRLKEVTNLSTVLGTQKALISQLPQRQGSLPNMWPPSQGPAT